MARGRLGWGIQNNKEATTMPTCKAMLLNLLFIGSLLGFDQSHAAGDLTRRTQALPDLKLGSEESDYAVSQKEYPAGNPASPISSR